MTNPKPNTAGLKPAWKPGQSGNPHGVPAAVVRKRNEAADKAAALILAGVTGVEQAIEDLGPDGAKIADLVDEKLALLKEAQDRAYGKSTQPNEHSSPDGSMARTVEVVFVEKDDGDPKPPH